MSDPENLFVTAFRIFQCLIGSTVIPPHHSNQAIRPVYHPAIAGGDRLFVVDARKLNGDQDFVKVAFIVFLIRENREAVKRDNNNIFDFMDSEGYIQRKADASISSKDFYEIYRMWCEENSLAPLKARSFSDAMIANAGRFNLEHCNNITNSAGRRVWGFMGVEAVARPHINGFYGDSPCTYVPEDIPEEWRQVE